MTAPTRREKKRWRRRCYRASYSLNARRWAGQIPGQPPVVVSNAHGSTPITIDAPWLRGATS